MTAAKSATARSSRVNRFRMATYTAGHATRCAHSRKCVRPGPAGGPRGSRLAAMASTNSQPKRRAMVLEALERTGSMRAAARATGVGERTIYRWRAKDGRFRVAAERRLERHRQQLADRLEQHAADVALNGARVEVLDRDGNPVELRRHDQRALDRALDRWAGWGQGAAGQLAAKAYHLELDGRELAAGLAAVFAAGLEAGKPREVVELHQEHGDALADELHELHSADELHNDTDHSARPGSEARPGASRGPGAASQRRGGAGRHSGGGGGVPRDARGGGGYKYIPHTPPIPPGLTGPKTS